MQKPIRTRILASLAAAAALSFTAVGCAGDDQPDVTAPNPSPVESSEAPDTTLPEGQCDPAFVEPLLGVSGVDTALDEVSNTFVPEFIPAMFAPECTVSGRLSISQDGSDAVVGNLASLAVLRGVDAETIVEAARSNGLQVSDGGTQTTFTTDDGFQGSLSWHPASNYDDLDALSTAAGIEIQPDDLILVSATRD